MCAVIAHEIAHAVARHQAEDWTKQVFMLPLAATAAVVAPFSSLLYKVCVRVCMCVSIHGSLLQYGYSHPHSRMHEKEADFIGKVAILELSQLLNSLCAWNPTMLVFSREIACS